MKYRTMIVAAALLFGSGLAAGQNQGGVKSFTWYDGGQPRTVILDPSVVAEFGSGASPAAGAANRGSGVRLWQQGDIASMRENAQGPLSPVLRDPQGTMRALPGNIIVRLNPAWSQDDVARWLAANQLQVLRNLPIGRNVLVLQSPPGLASLELANRLQQAGEVVSAQPDWWEQKEQR